MLSINVRATDVRINSRRVPQDMHITCYTIFASISRNSLLDLYCIIWQPWITKALFALLSPCHVALVPIIFKHSTIQSTVDMLKWNAPFEHYHKAEIASSPSVDVNVCYLKPAGSFAFYLKNMKLTSALGKNVSSYTSCILNARRCTVHPVVLNVSNYTSCTSECTQVYCTSCSSKCMQL